MKSFTRKGSVLAVAAATMLALGTWASAASISLNFQAISNNSGQASSVAPQLSAEIFDTAANGSALANQVRIRFTNAVGMASDIAEVYLENTSVLASIANNGVVGSHNLAQTIHHAATKHTAAYDEYVYDDVKFTADHGLQGGGLPGGKTISPAFVTNFPLSAGADNPASKYGINDASDWLDITFNLKAGKTWANVEDAVKDAGMADGLRVGLHVQSIGTSGMSDAFVSTTAVPVPAAVWGGLAMMAGLAVRKLRPSKA